MSSYVPAALGLLDAKIRASDKDLPVLSILYTVEPVALLHHPSILQIETLLSNCVSPYHKQFVQPLLLETS